MMLSSLLNVAQHVSSRLGRESTIIRGLRPVYENVLDLFSGGNGVPWTINGVTFRIDPHHRRGFPHVYDPEVAQLLRERIRPGDYCMNIGANVGVYVLQFAWWSRPNGRVLAFEPNPSARKVLEKHISLNAITDRVTFEAVAVGAEAGMSTLFAAGTDGMSRLKTPNPELQAPVTPIEVAVITIDAYCEQTGIIPQAIFMDIEGFEIHAVAGAARFIRNNGRDVTIVVEMHPWMWNSAGITRVSAERVLVEAGLTPIPLTGQRDPLEEYGHVWLKRD